MILIYLLFKFLLEWWCKWYRFFSFCNTTDR